jgi:hypothetical protein
MSPNPVPPPQSAATPDQATPYSVQSDAAAAARQQLPIAVSSTGAPVAYWPDTLQSRQAQAERRLSLYVPTARPSAEGGGEGAESAHALLANVTVRTNSNFLNSQLIKLNLPLSSEFNAQFYAGDIKVEGLPVFKQQPAGKKPGLSQTHGVAAYLMALTRNRARTTDTLTEL